jgi:hypothetical protein
MQVLMTVSSFRASLNGYVLEARERRNRTPHGITSMGDADQNKEHADPDNRE